MCAEPVREDDYTHDLSVEYDGYRDFDLYTINGVFIVLPKGTPWARRAQLRRHRHALR